MNDLRQKVAEIIWDWSTADMLTSDWLLECADAVIAIARPAGYAMTPTERLLLENDLALLVHAYDQAQSQGYSSTHLLKHIEATADALGVEPPRHPNK